MLARTPLRLPLFPKSWRKTTLDKRPTDSPRISGRRTTHSTAEDLSHFVHSWTGPTGLRQLVGALNRGGPQRDCGPSGSVLPEVLSHHGNIEQPARGPEMVSIDSEEARCGLATTNPGNRRRKARATWVPSTARLPSIHRLRTRHRSSRAGSERCLPGSVAPSIDRVRFEIARMMGCLSFTI